MNTMIRTNALTPVNYRRTLPDHKGDLVPQNMRDHRYDAGTIGWGVERDRMVDISGVKVKSCAKNVLREWDRYNNEVTVYGLGKQPMELNKKYKVDMYKYYLGRKKRPTGELSENARKKI